MAKYLVAVDFYGYSRGIEQFEVEAESEEDAISNWHRGTEVYHETIRGDYEREANNATLLD